MMVHGSTGGSIGKVATQTVSIILPSEGLRLESGGVLRELTVAYETYGTISAARDNVIFVCHALSGDAHVAGYHTSPDSDPGWWDEMIGPGKGIDTDHYFVVCANILGGCKGTTGPRSINPSTGQPYGSSFPPISVGDIVDVHKRFLDQIGVSRLAAVIGGSFGGMQVLEWGIRFPEMVDRCICIACGVSLSAQALAFDIVGREVITSDADWIKGDYYGVGRGPVKGLSTARKIGHITYLSPEMMARKFGRERTDRAGNGASFDTNFQVESYLDHQGRKFIERFDANSYLHITHAMDQYDLTERFGSLDRAFAGIRAKFLVVSLSMDWLFPPEQSLELASGLLKAGKEVSYCNLHAPHGHDAFLVDVEHLSEVIRAFLPWIRKPESERDADEAVVACAKPECSEIVKSVPKGARVIDIGCGDGLLLSVLRGHRGVKGVGVEIDLKHVITVIDRGHEVFQVDVDDGLAMFPDNSYDCAVLGETLQTVKKPRFVLNEILRIAGRCIVSFPNFATWSHRIALGVLGRMPKGGALPFEWYDTPNIHLFTLKDFVDVCLQDGIEIRRVSCVAVGVLSRLFLALGLKNLGADRVVVEIARKESGGK